MCVLVGCSGRHLDLVLLRLWMCQEEEEEEEKEGRGHHWNVYDQVASLGTPYCHSQVVSSLAQVCHLVFQ